MKRTSTPRITSQRSERCQYCHVEVRRYAGQRGQLVTADRFGPLDPHRCRRDEPARLVECSCGRYVTVTLGGTKFLWPSGQLHRTHPPPVNVYDNIAEQAAGQAEFDEIEALRADRPELPMATEFVPEYGFETS